MRDLLIGNTSQLSHYFPLSIKKISSRNIDKNIFEQEWNKVYICFAEQRTFKKEDSLFDKINFEYTKNIIQNLKAKTIIYYATAELWNNTVGEINIELPYNYHYSDYVASKEKITNFLKIHHPNVKIAYPFNFNSKYRMPPFLFGKIINSIAEQKKIILGDTYYYRELLHPSFIVNESLKQDNDQIIGTGKLIFINDFIRSLYAAFNMNYDEYVQEDLQQHSIYRKNIFYNNSRCSFSENDLRQITINEIKEIINENSKRN
jgi:nucleoside-diphosphate-sugar epimerase